MVFILTEKRKLKRYKLKYFLLYTVIILYSNFKQKLTSLKKYFGKKNKEEIPSLSCKLAEHYIINHC